jgi:glycyl-tRNA synthetase
LSTWIDRDDWGTILPAYSRCVRITRTADIDLNAPVSPSLFVDEAEIQLNAALEVAENKERAQGSANDFLSAFLPMIPAIDQFFDDVLVMVDDDRVRNNRLRLLQRITALAEGVADMSMLEGF